MNRSQRRSWRTKLIQRWIEEKIQQGLTEGKSLEEIEQSVSAAWREVYGVPLRLKLDDAGRIEILPG